MGERRKDKIERLQRAVSTASQKHRRRKVLQADLVKTMTRQLRAEIRMDRGMAR